MNTITFPIRTALISTFALMASFEELRAQHPLESWVQRPISGSIQNLSSIAFGDGVFVGVGDASAIVRSTDGVNWTVSTAGSYGNLARVRFLNGQFVAVGTSDQLLSSIDGITWTATTLPQAGFWDIAYGNGAYVLAGSATYVSGNGVDWTPTHPMLTRTSGFPPYETLLDTVLFGENGFLALPTGGGAPGTLTPRQSLFSEDGVNWVPGSVAPSSNNGEQPNCELAYADGSFVGTSQRSFFGTAVSGAMTTTDNGSTWCCQFQGFPGGGGAALAYGGGEFIWVQHGFNVLIFSSSDGIVWELRHNQPIAAAMRSAAFGHGTFVVAGVDAAGAGYIMQSGNISGVPTIVKEPQDRGAVVDNPASFSVQAAGAATLTYQWYKNSNLLTGETNDTYSIAHVSTSDIGGYHVVIANSFGSVTSRVAQLTVSFLDIDSYAGLKVLGVPGRTYRIEATPATGTPNWQAIADIVLPSSPYIWIDYDSPDLPARLYRVAELP